MNDAPSIAEELERKSTETLTETLHALSRGLSTVEAASASLRALWGAVSGLVSRELMDMIAESIDAIEDDAPLPRCRIMIKGSRTVIITLPEMMRLDAQLIMTKDGKIINKSLIESGETLNEMNMKVGKAAQNLIDAGFKEI